MLMPLLCSHFLLGLGLSSVSQSRSSTVSTASFLGASVQRPLSLRTSTFQSSLVSSSATSFTRAQSSSRFKIWTCGLARRRLTAWSRTGLSPSHATFSRGSGFGSHRLCWYKMWHVSSSLTLAALAQLTGLGSQVRAHVYYTTGNVRITCTFTL